MITGPRLGEQLTLSLFLPPAGLALRFGKGENYLSEEQTEIKIATCQIELPQAIIETFARFLVPEIRKYYDSEQGQREFAEWQNAQVKTE